MAGGLEGPPFFYIELSEERNNDERKYTLYRKGAWFERPTGSHPLGTGKRTAVECRIPDLTGMVVPAYYFAADLPPNPNETRGHPKIKFKATA